MFEQKASASDRALRRRAIKTKSPGCADAGLASCSARHGHAHAHQGRTASPSGVSRHLARKQPAPIKATP
jgi:hypothetical protein